jgi:outer membrane lipoprotein-sorting protein
MNIDFLSYLRFGNWNLVLGIILNHEKKRKRHLLLKVLFLLSIFMCLAWADTWEGIKSAASTITSVRAEFVQEKHMEILAKPIVSKGVFYFQAPNSLRWEYRSPVQSILLMHDGRTKRYILKNGAITEDTGAHLQSMQVVLQDIAQWLNGRFEENPAFSASLEPHRKIVLRLKDKSIANIIQRIELVLSDRPGIITAVIIYEGEKSYTRFEFQNTILNQPLQDSIFRKIS